ncbi:hypothetical protein [Streptomyces parvulus]|uniref:Lipoprotein n=1 Tax=Streptomyces parvulus TaxID=146923 RepID=A0A369V8C7_9ACTN|nr:hypothetical protein [Streptomyces parvulus]RDD89304.1 hypothetical protein DVZ84_09925 [Streptomyces parvulus]
MRHAPAARTPLAALLSAVLALTAAACAGGGRTGQRPAAPAPTEPRSPAALTPAEVPPVLTRGQARAALITEDDLGEAWEPTRGAATWRDELLKATAERPDCHRLLDVLYTEDLFGTGAPRATTALDDADGGAQLHYRVTSYRAADLDRALAWLATLPETCGHFTARAQNGAVREVRVGPLELPEAGEARQGVRVTVDGGDAAFLTVDLAAVRVGDDAVSLTNGTLSEPADDATWTAADTGARHLAEARRQGRAQV